MTAGETAKGAATPGGSESGIVGAPTMENANADAANDTNSNTDSHPTGCLQQQLSVKFRLSRGADLHRRFLPQSVMLDTS